MSDEDKYRLALELYETTYGEVDADQLTQGLHRVIAILEDLPIAQRNNADAFHLLGLCWYELPGFDAENFKRAEQAFRSALTVESDHQYANLFLGHVLFDTGRYGEARSHFETIDPDYFASRTQQWRVIKNAELILCCQLQTEWALVGLDEVEALCVQYETDPAVEFIVPREIVLCLDEFLAGNSPPQQAETYARRVVAMLERTDNLRIGYLRDPIARLTRLVSSEPPPNLPHAC